MEKFTCGRPNNIAKFTRMTLGLAKIDLKVLSDFYNSALNNDNKKYV